MSNDEREVRVRVNVLTLSDCDYCNLLKSELDKEGIAYNNIDAYQFPDFAQSIEDKFKTKYYPIVFIDHDNLITTLVSETDLETTNILRTFNTMPELIGIIKSYIK